jgi:hypothetical protein
MKHWSDRAASATVPRPWAVSRRRRHRPHQYGRPNHLLTLDPTEWKISWRDVVALGVLSSRVGWLKAPAASCGHLQLKRGFKKSSSMSGEVCLLAGDREFRMSDPNG